MMKTGGRTASEVIKRGLGLHWGKQFKTVHEMCDVRSRYRTPYWWFKTVHKMCDFSSWDITATVIREPTSRLLSHYRMLMQHEIFGWHRHGTSIWDKENCSDDPYWLGKSLELFLKKFPDKWKLHQLHFYSESGDVNEAFNNIVQNTQIILFERRTEGFDRLAKKLHIDPALFQDQPPPEWQTTKNIPLEVDDNQLLNIKDVLEKEYKFYNKVIDYYNEGKI